MNSSKPGPSIDSFLSGVNAGALHGMAYENCLILKISRNRNTGLP